MVHCNSCSREISCEAKICPHCGQPDPYTDVDARLDVAIYKKVEREESREAKILIGTMAIGVLWGLVQGGLFGAFLGFIAGLFVAIAINKVKVVEWVEEAVRIGQADNNWSVFWGRIFFSYLLPTISVFTIMFFKGGLGHAHIDLLVFLVPVLNWLFYILTLVFGDDTKLQMLVLAFWAVVGAIGTRMIHIRALQSSKS